MIKKLIAAALLACSAPVSAAWQEANSRHFVVYSDEAPERVRAFTAQLERYDKAMHVLRDIPDDHATPASRVIVFVVQSEGDVQSLLGKGNAAGFYTPRARGSVAFVPKHGRGGPNELLTPQEVLLHEYAHHFMFTNWGDAAFPSWFVEGFAEFNATAVFERDGGVTFGAPPLYRQYGMTRTDRVPARVLLSGGRPAGDLKVQDAFYARAWLLTHFLMADPQRRELLGRYLSAINAGAKPIDAAKLLGDPDALDRTLDRYALGRTLHAFGVPASLLTPGAVSVRPLRPGEAAVMPARIRTERGVRPDDAAEVAETTRRLAAPYPDDPSAQTELAEAEFDAGNMSAAEAASSRAVAADPDAIAALVVQGRARLADAAKAGAADPARWQAGREWLSRASRLDPDDPWPLFLLFRSFGDARQAPTAESQAGLVHAHELAPFDTQITMAAVIFYLRHDRSTDARRALQPVAYNPHGGETADRAGRAIAAIDAGRRGDAIAALRGRAPSPS